MGRFPSDESRVWRNGPLFSCAAQRSTPVSRCSAATRILLVLIRIAKGESQDADSPGIMPRSVAAHTAEDMSMRVSFPQASSGTRDLPAEARGCRRHVITRRMTSCKVGGFEGRKKRPPGASFRIRPFVAGGSEACLLVSFLSASIVSDIFHLPEFVLPPQRRLLSTVYSATSFSVYCCRSPA